MRLLRFQTKFLLASIIALCGSPLLAGGSDQGQAQEQDMPNVLIVRTQESQGVTSKSQAQTPQADSLQMEQQSAQVLPVRISIPYTAQGTVDIQQLVQRAEQASAQADVLPLRALQPSEVSRVPAVVQGEFQRLSQRSETEIFPWAWSHQPVGGYYNYAWPNYGYYGYGYAPYYVYNYGAYPGYYQPTFGIYAGSNLYPFNYGHYRRAGGWHSNYYYRHGGRYGRP